jgi:glycosyltransferase involved in cell wall biosynthesis
MLKPSFNYLVTIHNQEQLLPRVLTGIAGCAGPDSLIIAVLDGCTDDSEAVVRRFATSCGLETRIVIAPDVHEIRSINLGLREAKPGYCVIVQDDVILQEPRLEELVHALCETWERRIGYISFRLAADLRPTSLLRRVRYSLRAGWSALQPMIEDFNHLAAPQESLPFQKTGYGQFHQRMVGIKSPVCLTPELRALEPLVDEDLAPYCYDDVELSLRAIRHELVNGIFPIRFQSDSEWGGTRKDAAFSSSHGNQIRLRNRRLVWQKHHDLLRESQG